MNIQTRLVQKSNTLRQAQTDLTAEARGILVGQEVVIQKHQCLPRLLGRRALIREVSYSSQCGGLMVLLDVPRADGNGMLDRGPARLRTYIPVDRLVFA